MKLQSCLSTLIALILLNLPFPGFSQRIKPADFGSPFQVEMSSDARIGSPEDLTYIQQLNLAEVDRTNSTYSPISYLDAAKTKYAVVHLEFVDRERCLKAIDTGKLKHVICQYENFADAFVPATDATIRSLKSLPGVRWMEVDRNVLVPPREEPEMMDEGSRDPPLDIVHGGHTGLTGKGTIIAVVDTGIDFKHPDFITYDENEVPQSRILYFWDTESEAHKNGLGQPAPVKFPNGYPVGTIYSREDLNQELTHSIPRIPIRDSNGHGTSCAGIAAGNGKVDGRYRGVAPEADLIAVRVGKGPSLPYTYLIGAICSWLDEVAGKKPLVVSCSWGAQIGGRDGQMVIERQLNERFRLNRAGRAICVAAGNEGSLNLHSEVPVNSAKDRAFVMFETQGPAPAKLTFYVNTAEDRNIFVGKVYDTEMEPPVTHLNPYTNQLVIQVSAKAQPGKPGGVYIYTNAGKKLSADVYISPNARFMPRFATRAKQLSSPGTAKNVITVGSFDWNDQFQRTSRSVKLHDPVTRKPLRIGSPSSYSNPGPLRFGSSVKPEIAAPGQWFTAPIPMNVPGLRDETGFYHAFNGTSAATPYVAGLVALMMEQNPGATFRELRQRLIQNVSKNNNRNQFGHGRLDMPAIDRIFAGPVQR